ncbi:hypothetical protein [Riemerella anatipestifer]|uniref:hypothetical protein n=1 Tax=Riemerella anatipestifer TaxID=34085 RepID=UPI00162A5987|nr:hypothetical protein [Riemerella anatipestifer]MCW0509513.1 hypothetical protein [Riemerella anatipestifer]MRM86453.1 hypothetical protein [Riemerella anatipestifer]
MSNLDITAMALSLLELATAEAKKIFENYPELEEVYITSDMQGFKELEKAENQAAYLKNKKVHHFKRKDFGQPSVPVLEETNKQNDASADNSQDANLEEGDEGNSDDKVKQDTGLDNVEDQASDKGEDTKSENSDKATQDNTEDQTDTKDETDLDNVEDQADEETKTEEQERAELMAKYEAKHGKKAPHNIGLKKLRASVEN